MRRGVLQLPALGQHRLIEQHVREVVELRLGLQLLHQGMTRVHFENGLGLGGGLAGLLEHAREMAAHGALLHHQAGG